METPNVTTNQKIGILLGGLPLVANFIILIFGIELDAEQRKAADDLVQWGVVAGGALFASDAAIRIGRAANLKGVQVLPDFDPEETREMAFEELSNQLGREATAAEVEDYLATGKVPDGNAGSGRLTTPPGMDPDRPKRRG